MWAGAGEEAAASTIIYVCLHISAAKRPPVADEVPLCAVPYVQYAWAPAGTAKSPSQQRYTKFNSGPNKDVPGTSLMGRGWLPMWAGAGEEAAASTNIYVCLHISAAKRPPVAYEVPLCAVPYVQYAWGPVGTAKCPSQ